MTEQQIQRVLTEAEWSAVCRAAGEHTARACVDLRAEVDRVVAAKVAEALAAQVPDDGFCTTHPVVGREFCGCPAQVPDISARVRPCVIEERSEADGSWEECVTHKSLLPCDGEATADEVIDAIEETFLAQLPTKALTYCAQEDVNAGLDAMRERFNTPEHVRGERP